MKRFIRYLYEYEQGKRMRNVGFVKVEQGEDECILNIHGKGLRMNGEGKLKIYLIFEKDGECTGVWQKEAENINPALNETLRYTREDVGTPENYEKIDGIVLEHTDGRRYAAIWDETPMDVSKMRGWAPEDTGKSREARQSIMREEMPADEKEKRPEMSADGREERLEEPADRREEQPEEPADGRKEQPEEPADRRAGKTEDEENGSLEEEITDTPIPLLNSEDLAFGLEQRKMEGEAREWEPVKPQDPVGEWRIRKIQRSELSKLARCEWRLSNNNFLLHGYYNYHHLVLLEKADRLMLGVPGIYHEKEAAAAGAFGFAEFIARDRLDVTLSPEECNEEQLFGYWCRPVRRSFKWD